MKKSTQRKELELDISFILADFYDEYCMKNKKVINCRKYSKKIVKEFYKWLNEL